MFPSNAKVKRYQRSSEIASAKSHYIVNSESLNGNHFIGRYISVYVRVVIWKKMLLALLAQARWVSN